MKKSFIIFLVLLFFVSCIKYSPQFTSENVIKRIDESTVAIAVYYYMDYQEWQYRMLNERNFPIKFNIPVAEPIKCIAYIGAGTLLRDNHIITVSHLFDHDDNTYRTEIWVAFKGIDHFIRAELIAISPRDSNPFDYTDDYAVIKLKENVKRQGLRIAKHDSKLGEKVIYSGSVGGTAFFHRFGYRTDFKWFFKLEESERLHLSFWHDDPFICVFPGGNGDSGGGIKNVKGEIVGIMYLGIENYLECYIFSNPLYRLWDFLKSRGLEHIG